MTKRPHILIVEDDEWLAQQYVRTLEAVRFTAEYVNHSLAAMDVIDIKRPDVLLLDVLLPGGTIFTLLHELRSHTDLAAIPIILCTNSAERLAQEDVQAYGVARLLDKATMKPEEIVTAVKKVLL